MCKNYLSKYNSIKIQVALQNAKLLAEAESNLGKTGYYSSLNGFYRNPIFDIGYQLREQLLIAERNYYKDLPVDFIFHTPSTTLSMGGHSWFTSLKETLLHQGVKVHSFWYSKEFPELDNGKTAVLVTGYNKLYLDELKEYVLEYAKNKAGRLILLFSVPLDETTLTVMDELTAIYGSYGYVNFYTFHDPSYVPYDGFISTMKTSGYILHHITFAANPLFHFPSPVISNGFDYVFLGSANYDKIDRYNEYFDLIIKNYDGLILGPGWPWFKEYEYCPSIDKYLYAQSRVSLNLHIDLQIEKPIELNERTYILSACGVPQVIDSPKLLRFVYPGFEGAKTTYEYHNRFVELYDNPSSYNKIAIDLMRNTFSMHTSFNRTKSLINHLSLG